VLFSLSFSPGSLLFSQKEVSYGFEILHVVLSHKNTMVYLRGQILKIILGGFTGVGL
jgi:hypothetical protein